MSVTDGRIQSVVGACDLSEPWFLAQRSSFASVARINQADVSMDTAVDQAAELLSRSQLPLVYGLSRSSTDGQRAAVRVADAVGGIVDTTASRCHASSVIALQQVGASTCTLGEIRNRADLVVFWGVDPIRSHPRHLERYSVEPASVFLPRGRQDRSVVVVNASRTDTAKQADLVIQVDPDKDFEMLWALRSLLVGIPPATDSVAGVPLATLQDLIHRLKSCRCGVFFFGLGLATEGGGHRTVEALLRLTCELNAHTRFYAHHMQVQGGVTGADTVLCWQTGYPFGVNLSRGYPRYNPGEYTANDLLERKEVDTCLLVGSESVPLMSPAAREYLATIPTILLEYPAVTPALQPTIQFSSAVYGVHLPGTAYRMDDVPIPLRQILPNRLPSDEQILNRIARRITVLRNR